MRRALSLWRLYLQNNFGLSSLRQRLRGGERIKLLVFLLLIPSFVGFLTIIYQFFAGLYQNLPPGQEAAGLTIGFLTAGTLVFIFGIFYLLSVFFFAEDNQRILYLPLRPREIVGAKFATVLVNEYLTLVPFLVPGLIAWAQLFPEPFFWPRALISFLLTPLVPLSVAALVGLVVMRFVNLPKSRDFWRVAGILISLVVVFAFQFFIMRVQRGYTQEELVKLLLAPDGLMSLIGRSYPPALWTAQFLARGNFVALLELLLLSAGAIALVLFAGERLFLGAIEGGGEVSKRKKDFVQPQSKPRGIFLALLWRETALFVRNPVFLTNGILNIIFPPVIIFFLLPSSLGKLPGAVSPLYLELIAIGYIAALPSLSVLPATSISREGKQFWLSRLIPVAPQLQVLAKLLWSSIITSLGGLLGLVVLRVLFKLPFWALVRAGFVGFVGSIGIGALAVLMDTLWPSLEWTDPQKAMKGNLTGLYGMLSASLYLGGVAWLVIKLVNSGWGPGGIAAVLLGIFVAVAVVLLRFLVKRAPVLYWKED